MEEVKPIDFNEKRIEKNHIKLIKGNTREIVAQAINESFNKALERSKKDGEFIAVGQEALMAIEEKILTHYSRRAAGTVINSITGFISKITKKED